MSLRRLYLPCTTLCLLSVVAGRPARAAHDGGRERIYGGEIAETCEFPTTVFASGELECSGTLVHPRVILSAGHCGDVDQFIFGEDNSAAARRVSSKWCEVDDFERSDYSICVLDEPIDDIPIAPILQGCEAEALTPGASVLLSGFGYANNAGGGKDFGIKRWVEVTINSIDGTDIYIGGGGEGGCNGDSGGPAYI